MKSPNSLINALDSLTFTENGALAYNTSGNEIVDLVYQISVLNKKPIMQNSFTSTILDLYIKALKCDPVQTIAAVLYSRSILKGAGVRYYFRELLKLWVKIAPVSTITLLLEAVKNGWGYWDDWFFLFEYALEQKLEARKIFLAITAEELDKLPINGLFAKWFPRRGRVWQYVVKSLDIANVSAFRKKLTVVETTESLIRKCVDNKHWDIDYSKVPSKSFKRHSKTFEKFDIVNFTLFLEQVKAGVKQVKAGAIFPHEILFADSMNWSAKEAQWKSLPNIVRSDATFLPVLDCSGSMEGLPLQITHSLGIYLSERNRSVFKNKVLLFSHSVKWIDLGERSLQEKVRTLNNFSEVANTNFELVFKLLLNTALAEKVAPEDLPKFIVCLTDGQFDAMSCDNSTTIFSKYESAFKAAGYTLPTVVFWNLRTTSSAPEKSNRPGVILVSGSSPNAFKGALEGKTTLELLEDNLKPFMPCAERFIETL